MKTYSLVIVATLALCSGAAAQVQPAFPDNISRFAVGLQVTEFAYDFGFGIEVTTPPVWRKHITVRLDASRYWMEPLSTEADTWRAFHTAGIYLVYNSRLYDNARCYFGGGTFTLVGSKSTTQQRTAQGVAAIAGLEFFVARNTQVPVGYFFDAGFGRCKTFTEKMQRDHTYGEGIVVHTGFRFYL